MMTIARTLIWRQSGNMAQVAEAAQILDPLPVQQHHRSGAIVEIRQAWGLCLSLQNQPGLSLDLSQGLNASLAPPPLQSPSC